MRQHDAQALHLCAPPLLRPDFPVASSPRGMLVLAHLEGMGVRMGTSSAALVQVAWRLGNGVVVLSTGAGKHRRCREPCNGRAATRSHSKVSRTRRATSEKSKGSVNPCQRLETATSNSCGRDEWVDDLGHSAKSRQAQRPQQRLARLWSRQSGRSRRTRLSGKREGAR